MLVYEWRLFFSEVREWGVKRAIRAKWIRNMDYEPYKEWCTKRGIWECNCGAILKSERGWKNHQTRAIKKDFPGE
jgi:hypothetical protein